MQTAILILIFGALIHIVGILTGISATIRKYASKSELDRFCAAWVTQRLE